MTRFLQLIIASMITMMNAMQGVMAGEVTIVDVQVEQQATVTYRFSVTLKHDDEGWDHYADEWRVLSENGTVLGTRTLAHPHVDEQPFMRSLSNVKIPAGTHMVFIDARDSVHGRTIAQYEVKLP